MPKLKKKSLLTTRELEVLRLVRYGHTAKEVASQLFIAKRTVEFHLANIYTKLKVKNRVQAIKAVPT